MTRDILVQRMGLSPREADKVVKIHERYAESIRKAEEKHERQIEKIRKAEANELATIVGEERVGQAERLLRPPRLRLPLFGRQDPSVHGPRLAPPEYPGEGLDLRWLREWARNLTDLTPEQRAKMKALMERYREQLKTVREGFREKLDEILTSEQMERFRPPPEDSEQ
jgi:GTP1/Obg family GTP-binding protein